MAEQKNIPQIRFKGFTQEWKERKLRDIANVIGGGTPSTNISEYWNGNIDWYSPTEIGKDTYATGSVKKITSLGLEKSSARMLPSDRTILFTSRAGIGDMAILKKDGATNQGFQSLVVKDEINTYFLYSNGHLIKKYAIKHASGSTFLEISGKLLGNMDVNIPLPNEQAKLGTLFSHLDQLITLKQQKYNKLVTVKKAMLEKMFPQNGATVPQIRFKGFTEEWEEKKLGETKSFFTDGNYGEAYPTESDLADSENGIPFLRGSNLSEGQLTKRGANYITKEKHLELTSGHLNEDDIVLAVRGSLGALGYVMKENVGWNINSQLAIIRTEKKELRGDFLIQYLLSDIGQRELLSKNTGTALKQLPIKQLKEVGILITDIKEQTKIGQFFSKLDHLIDLQQRELEKLKQVKKGCLEKMFV